MQVLRTVPEHTYDFVPRGDFRILEAYMRALRSARSGSIYLENQFLWSPEIVEILAAKLRDPPSDDFRVVLLLPAQPEQRRRQHARPARPAGRGRRRRRPAAGRDDPLPQRRAHATRCTCTRRSGSSTTAG